MDTERTIVVGAGIIGIATAYYLAKNHGQNRTTLVDRSQPLEFTSAQSGENYRNWWPHPAMVTFTNRSIDLMEEIAIGSGNRINMNRRGYALATRDNGIDELVSQLRFGFGEEADSLLRHHDGPSAHGYAPFDDSDWKSAPHGVDIIRNQALIRDRFPGYDPDIQSVIHIRRGGDISGQQLGMHMLEYLGSAGVRVKAGEVKAITENAGFRVEVSGASGTEVMSADRIINAAGPFAGDIARMVDVDLPIHNIFQQKIAFEDRDAAIPRTLPFSVDLDSQRLDWTVQERTTLDADPDHAWLAGDMPGGMHCRPDGGDGGRWVKLGWAYNAIPSPATWAQPLDGNFPDIVLRGAARLNPSLKAYYGRLPRAMSHYGGWYTMTEENWPLIGDMGPQGAFMNCAMSGFGTMAACAAGELCAATVAGADLPGYAKNFSMARYKDAELMSALRSANKGVL